MVLTDDVRINDLKTIPIESLCVFSTLSIKNYGDQLVVLLKLYHIRSKNFYIWQMLYCKLEEYIDL